MGNYLYGTSAKITVAFFLKNRPVDLSGGYVGILIKAFINKSFIMSKVQVGLCSIICDEHLSMLDRIHGTRIDVDIRIKLLHRYLKTSCF